MRQLIAVTPDNPNRNAEKTRSNALWTNQGHRGTDPRHRFQSRGYHGQQHQSQCKAKFVNKCVSELRTYHGTYCKTLNNDQIMNYYNANNENNINVKDNKGLDQVPDSPEADLKELFNPAMVVEDTVRKQTSEQWEDLTQLLDKLQGMFSQNKYDAGCINLEPQRIHLISELPISLRPYRNSQQESKEIQTQIEKLLKVGFIRPSHSPYAAPVTLAYKKDEGKKSRLCIGYRKLNEITRKDSTPVPLIDFAIDNLTHAKIFSTLDLTSGYWQLKFMKRHRETGFYN
ncbi:retrovirus-related Pol polyprotein from transposon 17.6 [Trichonephila clavipes]|nr:retrovirus-related Pol polyprotein from transposon 17.6 [Trichonephila clavipes]